MSNAQETLSRLFLFRSVAAADIEELVRNAPPVLYAAGTVIFRQGDPADNALLVVEGRLEVMVESGESNKQVGDIRAGEIAGETALFARRGRRNATVTAREPSRCLVVDRNLLSAIPANPALITLENHLLGTLARRIRKTNQSMQVVWKDANPTRDTPEIQKGIGARLISIFRSGT